jgi:hypothetical protein
MPAAFCEGVHEEAWPAAKVQSFAGTKWLPTINPKSRKASEHLGIALYL